MKSGQQNLITNQPIDSTIPWPPLGTIEQPHSWIAKWINKWNNEWWGEWTHTCMNKGMNKWANTQTNEWTNLWTSRQIGDQTDGQVKNCRPLPISIFLLLFSLFTMSVCLNIGRSASESDNKILLQLYNYKIFVIACVQALSWVLTNTFVNSINMYLELRRFGNPFSSSLGSFVFVFLKSHKNDLANGKNPADGRARGR